MTFQANKPDLKRYAVQSAVAFAVLTFVIILDLVTKSVVVNASIEAGMPENGSYWHLATVIEGFFLITYVQNTGAAWSLGGGNDVFMVVVIIVTFIAIAAFLFLLFFPDKRKNMFFLVSLALITGGAAGNLIDRVSLGYVRDFLDFYPFGYNFPVFNVADMGLVVGVIMMIVCILVYFFRSEKRDEKNGGAADDSGDGV